jgi:uncharacterized protein
MQINVSKLLKEPVGSERDYQVNGTVNIMENGEGKAVQGDVKLTRTNRSILVKGKLNTTIEIACSRCLEMFTYPLVLDFEEEYFPTNDIASGAALPPPDEPSCFTIDEHQVIDLTEAVRQYALMATPMKPLCREDCAGL